MIDGNITATCVATPRCCPYDEQRSGRLVIFSSEAASPCRPDRAVHIATSFAIGAFCESLRLFTGKTTEVG